MIFEDASRHRWQITRRIAFSLALCGLAFGALFFYSTHHTIILPATADVLNPVAPYAWMSTYHGVSTTTYPLVPLTQRMQDRVRAIRPSPFPLKSLQKQPGYLTVGFLAQADHLSVSSFTAYGDRLDIVMPDWYSLDQSATGSCQIRERIDENVRTLLHQKNVAIFPMVTNAGETRWQVEELRTLLRSPQKRTCLVESLLAAVRRTDSKGLNVDFEGLTTEDRPTLTEFFIELADGLHAQNQLLTLDIPVRPEAFDLEALSVLSDGVILMAYDQHDPTSRPGPIAAQDWVRSSVEQALRTLPPDKLILGLANYSYDWLVETPEAIAQSSSYREVMQLAYDVSAKPEMDTASQNIRFGYEDLQDRKHEVWLLDANTLWNQQRLVHTHALVGASVWRLGLEDPNIWSIFGQAATNTLPVTAALQPIDTRIVDHGNDVFSVVTPATIGEVKRDFSPEGEIVGASYLAAPTSLTLKRIGQPIPAQQYALAIAPPLDAVWTPKILDLLETASFPAVFFLRKEDTATHPELVQDIAKRGFLIGSTASEAALQALSPAVLETELNHLQQELVRLTQKKTTIFQAPPQANASLVDQNSGRVLAQASQLGYLSVDSGINLGTLKDLSSQDRVTFLRQYMTREDSHVFTLNGLNGEQSFALLTQLIPEFQAAEIKIASLETAIQIPRERLEPAASFAERLQSTAIKVTSALRGKQWTIIGWIFFFTNVLSIIRILFLAIFALRTKHIKKRPSAATKERLITVVIPAYNEEKTIRRTIAGVQHSTHTNFIAMVVNDGSTDKTAKIVERMHEKDPRIVLINKPNGGKFSALNLAFAQATTDIIVTIDADTILHPKTLDALITPFEDPKIDAVCGNVEVGNVCNLLTGFQALEYITSQNFDRRAFESLNCIGVVPGATGAWRRQRVLDIGGYEADTLVEDADVTLRLLRNGGKIVYAPEARSRTEAPSNLKDLSKQRLRWSFGTFQCLRKHAPSFFHGTLGWIALPNIFFFQIIYPILSPIGDLVFLWSLITGQWMSIITGYFLFILIDFVGSVLAFRLEKRSSKLLLLIFIQRFFYRQFMYFIAFRSILAILRGTRQGWNKLTRTGAVHARAHKVPAH